MTFCEAVRFVWGRWLLAQTTFFCSLLEIGVLGYFDQIYSSRVDLSVEIH